MIICSLWKCSLLLNHLVYFDQNLHTSILSYHWHALQPLSMDEALLSISLVGSGHLVKMLITLEQHGIIGSNFANLFI